MGGHVPQAQEMSLSAARHPECRGRGACPVLSAGPGARPAFGQWPERRPPNSKRLTKQEMWPPPSWPLQNFICDRPLLINPRTAHHQGMGSGCSGRWGGVGETIRNTISVLKAGHKYLSSLSREEGQDDSSQFLVLTKEETVHETGHLPRYFYLSDPRVRTREA